MKVSFIIPTLNEHGNITRLIERINKITKKNDINNEIIVIDDNSTDGTIEDVKNLQKNQENLKLIVRKKPLGIGSAHVVGYNLAQGDLIISMDADLSHSPEQIPEFIDKINYGFEFVVSSRYIEGGGTDKNFINQSISKIGSLFLSVMFGIKIKDFSSGYRAIKKEIWKKIKNYKYSNKNNFLIESIYYAHKNGAKITEIPIFFKEREIGKSKTPVLREALKALILPFKIKLLFREIKKPSS
jgi:dolichol-phosphate mannosyltransferase